MTTLNLHNSRYTIVLNVQTPIETTTHTTDFDSALYIYQELGKEYPTAAILLFDNKLDVELKSNNYGGN